MSTLRTNTIGNVAGTQSTDVLNVINGSAKAWVNFNGTGTVAIRAAYNISSITDQGASGYDVNFTNAMPDANYSIGVGLSDGSWGSAHYISNMSASSFRIWTGLNAGTAQADLSFVGVSIFR